MLWGLGWGRCVRQAPRWAWGGAGGVRLAPRWARKARPVEAGIAAPPWVDRRLREMRWEGQGSQGTAQKGVVSPQVTRLVLAWVVAAGQQPWTRARAAMAGTPQVGDRSGIRNGPAP